MKGKIARSTQEIPSGVSILLLGVAHFKGKASRALWPGGNCGHQRGYESRKAGLIQHGPGGGARGGPEERTCSRALYSSSDPRQTSDKHL